MSVFAFFSENICSLEREYLLALQEVCSLSQYVRSTFTRRICSRAEKFARASKSLLARQKFARTRKVCSRVESSLAPDFLCKRTAIVLILSIFIGQVIGTAVGSKLFTTYGWRASAGLSLGLTGFMLCILLLRGPHCERYTWFGYEGGTEWRKDVVMKNQREKAEAQKGGEAEAEKSTDHEKDGDNAAVVGPSSSDDEAEKQQLDRKDPAEMV
ncbi:hypothetical protein EWM64_g8260 [Hericium alpestre]|uniref:Uncharacterized protein n=1 Tax=Hericium alpestre TaxID=135208 RepID=A0A4Y9ZLV3_9AGAM|nr:hypothetical protein EWM64_g8260 [Hericium alpestre]